MQRRNRTGIAHCHSTAQNLGVCRSQRFVPPMECRSFLNSAASLHISKSGPNAHSPLR
jgi:hypothetical protein